MDTARISGNPWTVPEYDFPTRSPVEDQIRFTLNYAVVAPSNYNAQPWQFRVVDNAAEILADRRRALPVVDPEHRLLTMACGAALTNLVIATQYFGREAWVQDFPDRTESDLLARVRPGRSRMPSSNDEQLFRAIRRRRTTRLPFSARRIPDDLLRRLIWLASESDCWIHIIDDPVSRQRLAEIVQEGNDRQLADAAFVAELDTWVRQGDDTARDGMPAVSAPGGQRDSRHFLRTFSSRNGHAARDHELIADSPTLIVIGSNRDEPSSWLSAGRALQSILLRTTAEGATASFLGQPCESPDLRGDLRALCGRAGFPQTVLRLGYAPSVPPSPRRPVAETLIPAATHA